MFSTASTYVSPFHTPVEVDYDKKLQLLTQNDKLKINSLTLEADKNSAVADKIVKIIEYRMQQVCVEYH